MADATDIGNQPETKRVKRDTIMSTDVQAELDSLDRILSRLAFTTDGTALENVLSKLIPIMIGKMDASVELPKGVQRQVQQKVLDILSHANKRMDGLPNLKLPIGSVWRAYRDSKNSVGQNIGLVYLGKAFDRCGSDGLDVVGEVVQGIHARPGGHQNALMMHVFRVLRWYPEYSRNLSDTIDAKAIVGDGKDLDVFMRHAVMLALYIPPSSRTRVADGARVVPGLSESDMKIIEGRGELSVDDVEKMMVGVLEFVSRAEPSPEDSMMFLLCASSSPYEAVKKKSEFMYAKTCVVDTAHPTVDVEKRAVVKPLFDMYLGSMEDQVLPDHLKKSPVNQSLKSRILGILCKSTVACNTNPEAIMVIHDCIFGETSNLSLKQQGMQFAVHVLKHADTSTIRVFAPSIIRQCFEILEGGSGIASLRGFAYQCLGQLAQRDPVSLQEMKMELMKRCFDALEIEGPGVRASVQETINCLANCFHGDADQSSEVWEVLEGYCYSENSSVRQTALQWIIWIFKFSDTHARYMCSVLCSDGNINISGLAREGLDVDKVVQAQGAKFGKGEKDVRAMPTLKDMVNVVSEKHPKIFHGSHDGLSTLFLPAPSLEALLGFLHSLPLDQSDTEAMRGYFAILSSCLIRNAPGSLQNASLDSLLYSAALSKGEFLQYFESKTIIFEDMLNHVDDRVSCKSARLLGFLRQSMPSQRLEQICARSSEIIKDVLESKQRKQEEIIGALFITGFLEAWKVSPSHTSPSASNLQDPKATLLALTLSDELKNKVIRATALLCIAYSSFGDELQTSDLSKILEEVLPKLKPYKDSSISTIVAEALGLIGMNAHDNSYIATIVDEILEFHISKDEKLLEQCGDALVCIWGGTNATRDQYLLLHAGMAEDNTHPWPSHSHGEKGAIREKILKFIANNCIASSRSESRMAGAIWLLRLIEGAPQTPEISDNVAEIQKAFCLLLGDSNERTRDLASKGVTSCYQAAKDDVREDLVASLVGILSGSDSGKWMRPDHVEGSTQIFEEGSLGSLPNQNGGISTYKEICSLATDLGQPDLIYQFMNLAGHQAAADATRGAAYGIASVASLAGDALKPHIDALIPRLFRSTFDPNPAVRDSMRHIWVVLVDNPKDALKDHLKETLSILTKDMTKQQWRVRESAALATADILQGLLWEDIKEFFPTILNCCFRIIDDVKESVRLAGQTLVRSITSLSIRLTDSDSTASSDSKEFLSTVFPVLIGTGMSSSLSDIRAISIGLITRLIKSAGPDVLNDKMQDIVPPLLESLSGLEDARLNYLEQHINRLGMDADRFEEERIRFSQQNPIGETLDLCSKSVDGKSFCDMSSSLVSLLRTAVGSSTKSGTANFIVACTRRIGKDVSPVAFNLMKVLYDALSIEKSASVRKSYATAYACLSKYAPRSKIDAILDSWLESCKSENAENELMILTGIILKSMSSESTDLFIRYADDIAPVAFMARYSDPPVATVWTNVWEEITTATGSGIRGHAISISKMLLEALNSSHWARKKAAGDGIVCLYENAGDLLANQTDLIASTVIKALPGRLWDGKEVLLKSLATIVIASDKSQLGTVCGGEANIVAAFSTACQKQKLAYRTEALIQTGRVLRYLNDKDFYAQIWPTLNELLSQHSERLQGSHTEEDGESTRLPSIKIILECLSSLWCQESEYLAERDASWNSVTATALLPILKYCEKIEDRKAALQLYVSLMQCSDSTSIPEDTVTQVAEEDIALLSSSRVESIRSIGSDLLHEIVKKRMCISHSISDLRSRLKDIESAEKSAAVRSKINAIISDLE